MCFAPQRVYIDARFDGSTFLSICNADNESDGGGIRGYASLLILRQIMVLCLALEHAYDKMPDGYRYDHEVDNELPLPCHYFDYMFGTSTGG